MGLRTRRRPEQRGVNSRKVSRHPACRGLSSLPGSHGEGPVVAIARRAEEHGNADYRIICDVAWLQCERAVLRSPGIAVFQFGENRPRSGDRLPAAQGNERSRSRAMAGAKPELRSRVNRAEGAVSLWLANCYFSLAAGHVTLLHFVLGFSAD